MKSILNAQETRNRKKATTTVQQETKDNKFAYYSFLTGTCP